MRVKTPGVTPQREGEVFDFEGRRVETVGGESLGAALLAAGERV